MLATRDYADVVLVDIKDGLPQGKALDINQMSPLLGYEPNVVGTNGYDESAGSSVVVITAGVPRGPGMSRDDLVATNEKIVADVTAKVAAASPDAVLIVVSNPLDAMCHVAQRVSGWPRERVFGMAGILDTAALRDLHRVGDGLVGEGRDRARARRPRRPDGAGRERGDGRRRAAAAARARRADRASSSSAPRRAAARSSACSARPPGTRRARRPRRWSTRSCSTRSACSPAPRTSRASTAIDDLYMGVPVRLGAGGMEAIVELELDDAERDALAASADAVREVVGVLTV